MATPVIDSTQSYLGYTQGETFSFLPGCLASPPVLYWTASSLPTGLSIDNPAFLSVTAVAATDVLTATGHTYVNGDMVYLPSSPTGGAGLAANTAYWVRDVSGSTFKLAASQGGAAIDITTDLTAGTIRKCGTGQISGSVDTPGQYVIGFQATNNTGSSSTVYFTIGIEASDGSSVVAGGSDVGIDVNIDVVTGEVSLANVKTDGAEQKDYLFELKSGDVPLLNVRFLKNGVLLDPNPTDLQFVLKEFDTEGDLVLSTAFARTGSGTSAVCKMPVNMADDDVSSALSNYEKTTGTSFTALAEIQWKQAVSIAGVLELIKTTSTFKVLVTRELDGDSA